MLDFHLESFSLEEHIEQFMEILLTWAYCSTPGLCELLQNVLVPQQYIIISACPVTQPLELKEKKKKKRSINRKEQIEHNDGGSWMNMKGFSPSQLVNF